jgi:N-acetylglucosamine-6-phosphate deacetylase
MSDLVLAGALVVDPAAAAPPERTGTVRFRDGRIASAALDGQAGEPAGELASTAGVVVDCSGAYLLPGWIDVQLNDIEWLARGLQPPAAHAERTREVARYQAARGVTGCILATLAAPEEDVLAYLQGMRLVLDGAPREAPEDEVFLGGLVEGTFMNPAFAGAHNPAHMRPPELALLDRFLDTGAARLVNIAPEMAPEAIDAIAHAVRRGAVVGVGHARPHAERVREAVAAGLRYVIHLGNGPTGSSLKAFGGGGLYEEALANDALVATLIIDGVHLDGRLVRDILERKGLDRCVAISDAGFACGNPAGDFEVFGIRGRIAPGGDYLEVLPRAEAPRNPFSSDFGPLFGSAADMRRVFETIVNLLTTSMPGIYQRRHPAMALRQALHAAARLCSLNPARLLGERDRGLCSPGARADAVLVKVDGSPGRYRVRVQRVWLGGREVAVPRPA